MKTSIRSTRLLIAAGLLAAVGVLPATAPALTGAATYEVKGTLSVTPESNENPGSWSISATMTLARGTASMPKYGTLKAWGALGTVSRPAKPKQLTITTGTLKISWADWTYSKGPVVYTMGNLVHVIAGAITSGNGAAGVIVYPWLESGKSVAGQLILVASGTVDK